MSKIITATAFYKLVTKGDIYRAFRHIISNNIQLKESTKYKVKLYDELFPPKDFLRIVAQQKGYTIKESTFSGGQANKPFEDLGYEITDTSREIHYWLYAPGRDAMHWDDFYDSNIMAIGWDALGDLKKYNTKDQIKEVLLNSYGGEGDKKNDVTANYDFYNNLQIGDVVIAKTGRSTLLGYGIVTSDYFYDDKKETYRSCRAVDWKIKGRWHTDHSLVLKTLTDITIYKSKYEEFEKYSDELMGVMDPNKKVLENKIFNMKLTNKILYGPPGTGKTYHTINKAIAIANPAFDLDQDRSLVKKEYDRLVKEGRIVFTTFHQSMAYEDFVEGIKPETKEGLVTYEVQDGVFKKLSNKAQTFSTENTMSVSKKVEIENRIQKLKNELEQSEDSEVEISMTKASYHITAITEKHIKFRKASGGTGHDLVLDSLRKIALGEKEMIGGLRAYYDYLINYLYEYKIEEQEIEENKPFVLIIDEINRGNVSAIFGELITLIEESKRLGSDEALTVTLPYSKETFGVPNNLHIIGTMNTADRSVEALDTALRRRFSFEEMLPQPQLINEIEVEREQEIIDLDLANVLTILNQRIEILLDRDHTIGHSYFMQVKSLEDLKNTFKNNILPLLQEYFYNDYGKIGLVLGQGFVKKTKENTPFAHFYGIEKEEFISDTYQLIDIEDIDIVDAILKLTNQKVD